MQRINKIETAVMQTAILNEKTHIVINEDSSTYILFDSIAEAKKHLKTLNFSENYVCTSPSYGRVAFYTRF